jgi:F-type H+-transporting ATPase subunit delta
MASDSKQSEQQELGREAQLGLIYAKALLGVTEPIGASEAVVEELKSVAQDVLPKIPALRAALTSPRVPQAEKEKLLDKAFGGRMTPQLLTFLKVVARHGRLAYVADIARAAVKLLDKLRNRLEVVVRTASPLSAAELESLRVKLSERLKADVRLVIEERPELIDASVLSQLSRMRTETVAKAVETIRTQSSRFAAAT